MRYFTTTYSHYFVLFVFFSQFFWVILVIFLDDFVLPCTSTNYVFTFFKYILTLDFRRSYNTFIVNCGFFDDTLFFNDNDYQIFKELYHFVDCHLFPKTLTDFRLARMIFIAIPKESNIKYYVILKSTNVFGCEFLKVDFGGFDGYCLVLIGTVYSWEIDRGYGWNGFLEGRWCISKWGDFTIGKFKDVSLVAGTRFVNVLFLKTCNVRVIYFLYTNFVFSFKIRVKLFQDAFNIFKRNVLVGNIVSKNSNIFAFCDCALVFINNYGLSNKPSRPIVMTIVFSLFRLYIIFDVLHDLFLNALSDTSFSKQLLEKFVFLFCLVVLTFND